MYQRRVGVWGKVNYQLSHPCHKSVCLFVCLCVFRTVFIFVGGGHMLHICVHTHVEARAGCCMSLYHSPYNLLNQGHSPIYNGVQGSPGNILPLIPRSSILRAPHHSQLVMPSLGSELRSSYLHGKHTISPGHTMSL